MIKKVSLIVFVLGVLILTLLLGINSIEVKGLDGLENMETNTKINLRGGIESERVISNGRKILSVNGIDVVCECVEDFLSKEVEIEGIVSEYEGKKQVEALVIRIS